MYSRITFGVHYVCMNTAPNQFFMKCSVSLDIVICRLCLNWLIQGASNTHCMKWPIYPGIIAYGFGSFSAMIVTSPCELVCLALPYNIHVDEQVTWYELGERTGLSISYRVKQSSLNIYTRYKLRICLKLFLYYIDLWVWYIFVNVRWACH